MERDPGEDERRALRCSKIALLPSLPLQTLPRTYIGERSVKRLHLSKALTISENTTVHEACRRMAAIGVDAVLLTDSNALLCGILTDKDIATRVIANELRLKDVPVAKVMTRNPVFVLSDTLAVEALQKMVKGVYMMPLHGWREHLRKEKPLLQLLRGWKSIGELQFQVPIHLLKHFEKECLSHPCQQSFQRVQCRVVKVSPSDSVLTATKKMLELKMSYAVVVVEDKPLGILTSRDILMRVIAKNLTPESTHVEKVMTCNPACGTIDMPIVDALHTMYEGKFLHLPVVDRDGKIVSVVDVINISHAAVATMGSSGVRGAETTHSLIPKFWESAMSIRPFEDDDDSCSDNSIKLASDGTDTVRSTAFHQYSGFSIFAFKVQDRKGRMHRFHCGISSLTELMASILQRVGDDIDRNNLPLILYEDEDHDKVVIASDNDLQAAVEHARQLGWKGLRLHLEFPGLSASRKSLGGSIGTEHAHRDAWASAYSAVAAGAALVAGLGVMAYLKRSST
ncbi:CBS domain-containing protein CBSCBSPB1 isoform X2 [Dendrobium catenatum]|uniref:CBS domain-containing protein CBSCBSPB1 isoform X2 n=1 Tax=Dendrobium catenatum TaxID=906689 RepID=UPI00109FC182|nr:CBS domain-containing protein CBSCBSPB1 isoform X2 [Dendrobium catenatum]